jgi:predicted DNA-binding helix-hairpin-helix protein
VARTLREVHSFRGYIHLKTIPEADPDLVRQAGLYADRLSINIELPTPESLRRYAPEKDTASIHRTMGDLGARITEAKAERRSPRFAPAGQSTQLIVGADQSSDATVLTAASSLYDRFSLRRIYYSAFSPIPDSSRLLPSCPAPLVRENRLYQADWLIRYYGFACAEITDGLAAGMLDPEIDPKLAWALRNRDQFPVDVNTADRELLLRVPGLGRRTVDAIIQARVHHRLRLDDIKRLAGSIRRVRPFVIAADHSPARLLDRSALQAVVAPRQRQLTLFG